MPTEIKLGNCTLSFSNVVTEVQKVFEGRTRFAEAFCKERGWDMNALSLEQILEIRKQPKWQIPKEEPCLQKS
jgi:hypothetical protein